jgi:hypothetical protein
MVESLERRRPTSGSFSASRTSWPANSSGPLEEPLETTGIVLPPPISLAPLDDEFLRDALSRDVEGFQVAHCALTDVAGQTPPHMIATGTVSIVRSVVTTDRPCSTRGSPSARCL